MPTFPTIRVGVPAAYQSLTAFPLFTEARAGIDYLLADEAIASGVAAVEEVNESGSVPTLLVRNQADRPVLFLEGEELRGAKQNRVLNTSVLVAPGTTTIPVSCVEQGRWRLRSRQFGSSGSHSSSRLRHVLKRSVSSSALEGLGHSSDQTAVWQEVSRQMTSLGSCSATMAMSDTYDAHLARLDEYRGQLGYPEGACGLAVAIGGKVASIDLFDRPGTCRKVWDRLLSGLVLDALEAGQTAGQAPEEAVQGELAALRDASWQQAPAAGAGEEFRAEAPGGRHASALALGGVIVHASLVTAW
jgi:hypothetical protein